MFLYLLPAFLAVFILAFTREGFCAADNYNLQIIVTVPKNTPAKDKVYVSGNHRLLGNWKHGAALMTKIAPCTYEFNAYIPKARRIEFKFNRGDFKKIEKSFEGFDTPNRFINLDCGGQNIIKCRMECEVEAWKDMLDETAAVHSYKLNLIGDYELFKKVDSKYLELERDVIVWMPEGYSDAKNRSKRYPVLYMHDGNNLFDARLSFQGVDWGVDEAIDRLVKLKKIKEIIVVGVYNTEARLDEYAPMRDEKRGGGGLGAQYSRFIVEELKPYIDDNFRTLPDAQNTAVGGSSLGGLISLYMGLEYPDVFGGMLVISPALYWDNYSIIPWAMSKGFDDSRNKLWMDMGLLEGRTALRSSRILDGEIRKNYPRFKNYKYREFKDAQHNEAAWRARMHLALGFMFGL
jgi:predicted alpha/beta superfamily hydrolase